MGDLTAKCDWHDSMLSIVLPDDPDRIAVRLFDSRNAPARMYVPEVDALQLQAENAKLRELVRDMNKWLWNGADCTECPFVAKCDLNAAFESDIHAHICLGWSEIHDRMRELGVEV